MVLTFYYHQLGVVYVVKSTINHFWDSRKAARVAYAALASDVSPHCQPAMLDKHAPLRMRYTNYWAPDPNNNQLLADDCIILLDDDSGAN